MPDITGLAPFSLDDVTPIADLIGDASIVAIGENNHHIHEFGLLRDRLLRHLVEHRGFTVLGFESGFAEGRLIDAWLHGGPGGVAEIGRDGFTFGLGESSEVHDMLTWLRERGGVRFAGLDLPSSAGSPVPSLQAVAAYLQDVDPGAVGLVEAALAACEPYASVSSAIAPRRFAATPVAARDAATSALTVVRAHLASLAPVYRRSPGDFDFALHNAEGALRVDMYLRELDALMSGRAPEPQSSSRDIYMAETVRLLRRRFPGEKIVLMLHNGHLQRVPFSPMPGMRSPSAGTHLSAEFGDDYFALALTGGTGTTTGLATDEDAPLGFRIHAEELGSPEPDSVEAALGDAGCLVDLRTARAKDSFRPQRIRHAHMFSPVDVVEAFDALVHLPRIDVCEYVTRSSDLSCRG